MVLEGFPEEVAGRGLGLRRSVCSLGLDTNLFSSHRIPDWLERTGEIRKRRAI